MRHSVWDGDDEKIMRLSRANRRLRKELKAVKDSMPKTVRKDRMAMAVLHGLDVNGWDKAACCGAKKEGWLGGLFDYLKDRGVMKKGAEI